jgi:hypothetical protein
MHEPFRLEVMLFVGSPWFGVWDVCVQVAFDFSIDLSRLSRPGIIETYPSTGKVAAGEKARVKLKVHVTV